MPNYSRNTQPIQMHNKMRTRTVEKTILKTYVEHQMVDVIMGESFSLFASTRKFELNITPYSEPTLVPIIDIVVGKSFMEFNATIDAKVRRYRINFGGHSECWIIGELIKTTNEGEGFNHGWSSNNDIEYQSSVEDGNHLTLSNRDKTVIDFLVPSRRIVFVRDYSEVPATVVNSLDGSVKLVEDRLDYFGKNVNGGIDFQLSWKLDFSPEIIGPISQLIRILVEKSGPNGNSVGL